MIEPYEITYQGRVWHGNVALGEHHLVEREGRYSAFQVREMVATTISASLAEAVGNMMPGQGSLISPALREGLRNAGLIPPASTGSPAPPALPPPHWPVISIGLFIAQRCNMRCPYCYGGAGEYGQSGLMSEGTALAAVDWLLDHSFDVRTVSIGFFGGEPLLDFPLLRKVVAYAKRQATARGKVVQFNLTTNGSLLNDAITAFLQEEGFSVMISFDGPREIQDRQRPFKDGHGSYSQVYPRLQQLLRSVSRLTARATICGDSDPFVVRKELESAGFARFILTPVSHVISRRGATSAGTAPFPGPARRMLDYRRWEVARMFRALRERTLVAANAPRDFALLAGLADRRKRHAACGVGRGLRVVSVEGDIYPCHPFVGLSQARLGHLRDYRAGEINDYHRAVVENLPACRHCWARYFCGGGCFYQNQACTGDMHQPDPLYCREMLTICEDLIDGWCALKEADQDWAREKVKELVPDQS